MEGSIVEPQGKTVFRIEDDEKLIAKAQEGD
jgi:hypothetical protein